jgi:citrate synthase
MSEGVVFSKGLENVIIKTTSITFIDGIKGILRYRGFDIQDLAKNCSYEEVVYLMLFGKLPNQGELKKVRDYLDENYTISDNVYEALKNYPKADAIQMMEAGLSLISLEEKEFNWNKEVNRWKALEIIAKVSTLTALIYRIKEGLKPAKPEKGLSYAENFLLMSIGKSDPDREKAMNAALVLYADHEVPASTTAALVAASTLSDMYSSVVAALATLKGPLHGGAAEAAFQQFIEIGSPANVEKWFTEKIVKGKNRLMGFGHRVYRTMDPRAKIFKEIAFGYTNKDWKVKNLFEIATKLESLGIKQFSEKGIWPNTDFYSGIVYYAIGFPIYMYTALFALSRTVGWLSNIIEYVEEQHRLIRPRSIYVGPEKQEFIPLERRG